MMKSLKKLWNSWVWTAPNINSNEFICGCTCHDDHVLGVIECDCCELGTKKYIHENQIDENRLKHHYKRILEDV